MTIQIERVPVGKDSIPLRKTGRFRPEKRFVMRIFWEDSGHFVDGTDNTHENNFILAALSQVTWVACNRSSRPIDWYSWNLQTSRTEL